MGTRGVAWGVRGKGKVARVVKKGDGMKGTYRTR